MKIKRVILSVITAILLAQVSLILGDELTKGNEESTKPEDQLIKKVEERIFYAERQKTLDSADYTLIWSTPVRMPNLGVKIQYGDKKHAKGIESGFFPPKPGKKQEIAKDNKDKTAKPADDARTWPDYKVQMGPWDLSDPANLLMQIFSVPLRRTFPNDNWACEAAREADGGYSLAFMARIARPVTNSAITPIVSAVTLNMDKNYVVRTIRMQFADDPLTTEQLKKDGIPYMKTWNDSITEVKFDKYKDKLLIKELDYGIASTGHSLNAPSFKTTFQFKEFSGLLFPTVKDMALFGGELSGTMTDQEWHFLIEYLDYKVVRKNLYKIDKTQGVIRVKTEGISASDDMAVNIQAGKQPQETLDTWARDWAAGWWHNMMAITATYTYSGSGGTVTFSAQYPGKDFPLCAELDNPDVYTNTIHFTGEGNAHRLHLVHSYVPEFSLPVKPDAGMKASRIAMYPNESWIDTATISGFKMESEYVLWDYTVNTGYEYIDKWVHWWKYKINIDIGFNDDLSVKDGGINETIPEDKGDGGGQIKPPNTSIPLAKDYITAPNKFGWGYGVTITRK